MLYSYASNFNTQTLLVLFLDWGVVYFGGGLATNSTPLAMLPFRPS